MLGEEGPPPSSNFEISNVRASPIPQQAGQSVTLIATFHNLDAQAITANYYVTVGWQLAGQPMKDQVIADLSVVLQAGETKDVELGWTIPTDWMPGENRWFCFVGK